MRPSIPIPQEIIDEIIASSDGEVDTLKACALTSHSFLPESRKQLFSTITLHSSKVTARLYCLLSDNPGISLLIRDLSIVINKSSILWFWMQRDIHLSLILPKLTRLRRLFVGCVLEYIPTFWHLLPADFTSALHHQFQSRNLHTLGLSQVCSVPYHVLGSAVHVKRLSLEFVGIARSKGENPQITSMEVESIYISGLLCSNQEPWPSSNIPRVQRLSLEASSQKSGNHIIRAGGKTIKEVVCRSFDALIRSTTDYEPLDFSPLLELRRLSFLFTQDAVCMKPSMIFELWRSLVGLLENSTATKKLEELSFTVPYNPAVPDYSLAIKSLFFGNSTWWKDLNSLVGDNSKCPNIHTVRVYVSAGHICSVEREEVVTLMRVQLPTFCVVGTLAVETCDINEQFAHI